ncbi:MAG: hypothetical protein O2954_03720 [bacterium]|nr:hypothetical protein [bacterium]
MDLKKPAQELVQELFAEPDRGRQVLLDLGFRDPDRVFRNLQGLSEPEGAPSLPAGLFRELTGAPDSDMALNNFERLSRASFGRASFFRGLDADPRALHTLVYILGGSQFLADLLVRDPEYFYWLLEKSERLSGPSDRDALAVEFAAGLTVFQSLETRLNAVRRLARRELLRLGAGDLVGSRTIQMTAAGLSDLADVCLDTLLNLLLPDMQARYGLPLNREGEPVSFAVIGLGKLGGRELNFSSDIDLMFGYSEEGETDGGEGGQVVDNQTFFTRLAEQLIRAATEPTEQGFLYRIDMRLRPDGASGALTMPLSAYERYYVRRGELWEQQMLIKARLCAGSVELGQRFLDTVQPFVYPRHFEVSPVEEIRRIKRRIEDRIGRKGEGETHLKLRSGGIRDIEFIVQCLQLLVGRVHTDARSGNTLEAIGQLQGVSALSDAEAGAMRAAYVFFRRLEHRLQMMHGLSDYSLPESGAEQGSLARCMGFDSAAEYVHALERHLETVQTIYREVFSETGDGEGRSVGVVCEMEMGDPEAASLLAELGFAQPEAAHRNLVFLAYDHVPRIRGTRARQSFVDLAPALMQGLQASADSDLALSNLERLISAYGAGDTLFRILGTNPGLRELLLSLCSGSQFLVNVLVRNPGLLDWITTSDVLYRDRSAEELAAEVDAVVDRANSDEAVVAGLNGFKNRELLRIGTRDLVELTDSFETFEALSLLAETVLNKIYEGVYARLTAVRGTPLQEDGQPAEYAILGLGKLGGRELNFGSDLDLVFVYSEDGKTDGDPPLGNLQFFIDLSQQVLNQLGQSTPYGMLYPVDARLRPEGGNALLALSYDSYDRYLKDRGATWERLALSRCRLMAGSAALGKKLLARIETFVLGQGLSESETGELVDVRRRMETHGTKGAGSAQLSIKTGPGGIVDIEFIVQVLQIRYGYREPDLRSANTLVGLARLVERGYVTEEEGEDLRSAFVFLRTVEKVLRRQDERARTRLPSDEQGLLAVARMMGHADCETFMEVLRERMGRTREIFRVYLPAG